MSFVTHHARTHASRLQAEYLPLPASSPVCHGNLPLLTALLASLFPTEALEGLYETPKLFLLTLDHGDWNDVKFNREEAEEAHFQDLLRKKTKSSTQGGKQPTNNETKPPEAGQQESSDDDAMQGVIEEASAAATAAAPAAEDTMSEEPPVEDEDIFISGNEFLSAPAEEDETFMRSSAIMLLGLRMDNLF